MSLLKCPKCGEMFSDSYKTCPFCAEDDAYFDGGVKPRKIKGAGRRVEGHSRGPSILGPALIVVVLLLAAVLIYSFFGEKISQLIHRNDPEPVEVTLTVEPTAAELSVGEIRALTAAGVENVVWNSSDEKVATVDEQGSVTAVNPGTATITVSEKDGKLSAQCQVTVTEAQVDPNQGGQTTPNPDPNQGGQTTPNPDPNQGGNSQQPNPPKKDLAIGEALNKESALDMVGSQYDLTFNLSDAYHPQLLVIGTDSKVTWSSSDSTKVKVDEDGNLTRLASGDVIITAKVDGQTLECIVRG